MLFNTQANLILLWFSLVIYWGLSKITRESTLNIRFKKL